MTPEESLRRWHAGLMASPLAIGAPPEVEDLLEGIAAAIDAAFAPPLRGLTGALLVSWPPAGAELIERAAAKCGVRPHEFVQEVAMRAARKLGAASEIRIAAVKRKRAAKKRGR